MNAASHKARIERFDFFALRDFSQPLQEESEFVEVNLAAEAAPVAPPPPPTYSQAELDKEKAMSFSEGLQKGITEGRAGAENDQSQVNLQLQQLMSRLNADLTATRQEFLELYQSKYHELIGLALAVAGKVAGTALKESSDQIISSLIEQTLPMLLRQPKVIIAVHPEIKSVMESHVLRIAMESGYEGTVIVNGNPALAISDCRLEWQDGAVERNSENIWKEILQVIEGKAGENHQKTAPAQEESAAPAAEASAPAMPDDVYHYISHTLETIDSSLFNPDHRKE